jgi:DNA-binding response OmpR family regulator
VDGNSSSCSFLLQGVNMGKKIAIIEDDLTISQMYKMKFEVEGFEVETAENGKLGLEMLEKNIPDVVLLDLMMPEMNGDEMLVQLRKTDWGKNIKVIILTNISKDEASKELVNLGIEDYVVKANFTPKQVIELVEKVLAK